MRRHELTYGFAFVRSSIRKILQNNKINHRVLFKEPDHSCTEVNLTTTALAIFDFCKRLERIFLNQTSMQIYANPQMDNSLAIAD